MTFTYNDTPVSFQIHGQGPPVVLLHGFLESSSMWEILIPEFSASRQLIIPDLPGFGKSGVLSTTHTMEEMAGVVQSLLEFLETEEITLIGHSMGGYISLACLELFPDKIKKVILLNSTPAPDSEERKQDRTRALEILDKKPKAFIAMTFSNWGGPDLSEKQKKILETYKKQVGSFPVSGIKAAVSGMKIRKDRTEVLKNFKGKKYFLLAKNDSVIPYEPTLKTARNCGATIHSVTGGHMSLIEKTKETIEFLQLVC